MNENIQKLQNQSDLIDSIIKTLSKDRVYISRHAIQLFGMPELAKLYYHIEFDILGDADDKHLFQTVNNDPADIGGLDSSIIGTDDCFIDIANGKDVLRGLNIMCKPATVKAVVDKMKKLSPKDTLQALYSYVYIGDTVKIKLASPVTIIIMLAWALHECELNRYELDSRIQLLKTTQAERKTKQSK